MPAPDDLDLVGSQRIHVVLAVDGFDMLVQFQLGVADDVQHLLARADAIDRARYPARGHTSSKARLGWSKCPGSGTGCLQGGGTIVPGRPLVV